MPSLAELTAKFRAVWPLLNERTRRLMAASEAKVLGHGGVTLVRRASGLSRKAIRKGIREIEAGIALPPGRMDHPDRDAQFRYINRAVKRYLAQHLPVISMDTKKKELLANYVNAGQQWRPVYQRRHVQGHDFPTPQVPRVYPFGIYDIGRNHGFVNLGTNHGRICGGLHPRVVAAGRPAALSAGAAHPDHGRRRGKQWLALAAVKLEL